MPQAHRLVARARAVALLALRRSLARLAPLAPLVTLAALASLGSLCTACTTLAYVTQAAAGQEDLNRRAIDIDALVEGRHVDARMRRLLSQVAIIKRFGEANGLTATTNYTRYVHLDRPVAVWVVSASEPLRFRSKTWGFPFVGSFTYLGWFDGPRAKSFAAELEREGWDVDVRGADAYSTTGYFEDSVLSTMIPRGDEALGRLANTILHESSHATIFVRGQSTLNESVANFVGDRLAERYLDATVGATSREKTAYLASEGAYERRARAMRAAYEALDALYASSKPDAVKLEEKRAVLARLRGELGMRRPVTNATILQYKTYNSGLDDLAALLDACGGDWPRFVRSVKRLESSAAPRAQVSDVGVLVKPLIDARCPG